MEQEVGYINAQDQGTPLGPVRVYGYIPFDSAVEEKRQHLDEALWHLSQIKPLPPM
jgi:ribosomal protein L11 methyltransferase